MDPEHDCETESLRRVEKCHKLCTVLDEGCSHGITPLLTVVPRNKKRIRLASSGKDVP